MGSNSWGAELGSNPLAHCGVALANTVAEVELNRTAKTNKKEAVSNRTRPLRLLKIILALAYIRAEADELGSRLRSNLSSTRGSVISFM